MSIEQRQFLSWGSLLPGDSVSASYTNQHTDRWQETNLLCREGEHCQENAGRAPHVDSTASRPQQKGTKRPSK